MGLWAIESANANSWGSLKKLVLGDSKADILLAQETKIITDDALQAAQRQARSLGWNPSLSLAHRTASTMGLEATVCLPKRALGLPPSAPTPSPKG